MKREGANTLPFAVRAIPGKGFGCVALRNIALGERLITEAPLLICEPGSMPVGELVEGLSARDQEKFFALSQDSLPRARRVS